MDPVPFNSIVRVKIAAGWFGSPLPIGKPRAGFSALWVFSHFPCRVGDPRVG